MNPWVTALVAPILREGTIGSCSAVEYVATPPNAWSRYFRDRGGLPRDPHDRAVHETVFDPRVAWGIGKLDTGHDSSRGR